MNRYSLASKKRWSKISKEERSERMRQIALIKHKKMTPEEKQVHMKRMNDAKVKAGSSG